MIGIVMMIIILGIIRHHH
ncbi:hypothetical protein MTR67_034303 [Solanum verrucosum]|uniref:Uncharacterized protein n=1 Tax=Solanum verrucosum TaxID=315347 RepID=A0AAF0U808_SOLVR|nr:hypothetical protein MTR67_034303 [Solanum verrucosum]